MMGGMSEQGTQKGGWTIVVLLFLFMVINFADKAVVGLAAVPIMAELHLTPKQFGLIGSAFFLLFSFSAVVTGFVVNRVQTRWVLLAMGLVWAATQFPMLGTVGFATIIASRIALGAGEGPAYPVAIHATYKWFPNELRTLPTAIIAQGGGVGIMIALPSLNWVLMHYSWHWAFGVLGIVGLLWCVAWLALGREGALAGSPASGAAIAAAPRVPYLRLLLNPTIIASWCANFGAYWGLSQALTWQGAFLVKGLGFPQGGIGPLAALPAFVAVVAVVVGGWLSQALQQRGLGTRLSRGVFAGSWVMAGGFALLVLPYMPTAVAEDRHDDHRRRAALDHLCHRPRRRRRDHSGGAARRDIGNRHRGRQLGRPAGALCDGQHHRERGHAARRLQHWFLDLRPRDAVGRRYRRGADAPRARGRAARRPAARGAARVTPGSSFPRNRRR